MQANVLASTDAGLGRWLQADEQLLWTGRPVVSRYVRVGPWFPIPVALMWCGFAVFWLASVIATGAPVVFWLAGIPFVLIGLYMVFGRFIVGAREARRTLYALTDRRVIIVSGLFRSTVTSLWLTSLPEMQVTEDADGTGTISFGGSPYGRWTGEEWPTGPHGAPSFMAIERVSDVARMIDEARSRV